MLTVLSFVWIQRDFSTWRLSIAETYKCHNFSSILIFDLDFLRFLNRPSAQWDHFLPISETFRMSQMQKKLSWIFVLKHYTFLTLKRKQGQLSKNQEKTPGKTVDLSQTVQENQERPHKRSSTQRLKNAQKGFFIFSPEVWPYFKVITHVLV